jgi:2-succinyl-5-enolpyruvyl-6-hydroxy-3-cyclohexene-1-carboxylate synthase
MSGSFPLDFRNVNALWASVLAETLVRCNVLEAVACPGSRSTPITMALARHPGIRTTPVLDERSAAFFALGLAKERNTPVALVCTSGTAAANFFPAIIEARESGVPLIVITADRPPEMRACASGQTIDQQKLYGDYVNFYHECALPEASEPMLRYLRQTVVHACERSLATFAGPVHLNMPFRDPLPPIDDGGATAKMGQGIDWVRFFEAVRITLPDSGVIQLNRTPRINASAHGVIVVGPESRPHPQQFVGLMAELTRKLGWPVITDGLSPLRNFGSEVPNLVTTADTILRNPTAADRLKPEFVLCIGDWPTSKVLRAWIEKADPQIFQFSDRPDNRDALHGRTQRVGISLGAYAQMLSAATEPNGYEKMWTAYEKKARAGLDSRLSATSDIFEGKAAWLLAQHLPEETPLFIASSMPVRDVEYFWPPNSRRVRPLSSRGANGIDGTLSTALGIAHRSSRPAVLLTGDLALLHDTNGFLLRPKLRGSLTIVLINNRGGGIFEHLPVAQFNPPFEEFFATPQEVDFAQLSATYSAEHVLVRDWAHFTELVSVLPKSGIRVLEVRTDRKRDAATRKAMFAEIAATL